MIMTKELTMHSLMTVLFGLFLAFPCFAEHPRGPLQSYNCPDKVKCEQRLYSSAGGYSSNQTIGVIHIKTCYKFPIGCRPWHCDGDKTNSEYWFNKCNDTFPECSNNHAGFTDPFCTAHFETY